VPAGSGPCGDPRSLSRSRPSSFPTHHALAYRFRAAHIGLIHFQRVRKAISSRPDHGPPELVEPSPGRVIAARSTDQKTTNGLPYLATLATRARNSLRPTQLQKILTASTFGREPHLEFTECLRVVFHTPRHDTLRLLEATDTTNYRFPRKARPEVRGLYRHLCDKGESVRAHSERYLLLHRRPYQGHASTKPSRGSIPESGILVGRRSRGRL